MEIINISVAKTTKFNIFIIIKFSLMLLVTDWRWVELWTKQPITETMVII